jgi:hypothetical protein
MGEKLKVEWWRYPGGGMYQVTPPYYPASCDNCGWRGSSEDCGTDTGGDDSDVYCPVCHMPGCDGGADAEKAVRVSASGRPLKSGAQQ